MTRNRLIIINVCWLAFVVWAAFVGHLQFVFVGDGSYASYLIAAIVAASMAGALAGRYGHLSDAAWLCETLGFVGTLVGITVGLSRIDMTALASTDGIVAAANSLFAGMGTAFCSTITGALGMLWIWSAGKAVKSC